MGIDMTLYVELYGSEHLGEREKEIFDRVNAVGLTPAEYPVKILRAPVVRWWNEFSILQYFIDHFDAEECRETFLEESDLQELLYVCNTVLGNPEQSKTLLPSYNHKYDDSYWNAIKQTHSQLNQILSVPEFIGCDYYFRFS